MARAVIRVITRSRVPSRLSRRLVCRVCFFFSSRRRHTRCLSDWSSDVCSSDLFIINNPANLTPTIASVAPACAVVGSPLAITVTGTNFMNVPASSDPNQTQFSTLNWTLGSSQLQLTPHTATTITATQITATIPATSINASGTATVTVSNPPSPPVPNIPGSTGSGGGTSAPPATVTVQTTACQVAAKAPANSASTGAVAQQTPAA